MTMMITITMIMIVVTFCHYEIAMQPNTSNYLPRAILLIIDDDDDDDQGYDNDNDDDDGDDNNNKNNGDDDI